MNKQTLENKISTQRKGTYIKMSWKTSNGDYTKISEGVVRLFSNDVITCKNGNEIIRMRTTKNANHKAIVKYFLNGVEITENEFYDHNKKQPQVSDWFSKSVTDIISIG